MHMFFELAKLPKPRTPEHIIFACNPLRTKQPPHPQNPPPSNKQLTSSTEEHQNPGCTTRSNTSSKQDHHHCLQLPKTTPLMEGMSQHFATRLTTNVQKNMKTFFSAGSLEAAWAKTNSKNMFSSSLEKRRNIQTKTKWMKWPTKLPTQTTRSQTKATNPTQWSHKNFPNPKTVPGEVYSLRGVPYLAPTRPLALQLVKQMAQAVEDRKAEDYRRLGLRLLLFGLFFFLFSFFWFSFFLVFVLVWFVSGLGRGWDLLASCVVFLLFWFFLGVWGGWIWMIWVVLWSFFGSC